MNRNLIAIIVIVFIIMSCASIPVVEGFEEAKIDAYKAQKSALNVSANNEAPELFNEGESALSLAEEKEVAEDIEGAMSAYIDAKIKYKRAIDATNKKKIVDDYVEETRPLLEELDERLNELE